MSASKSKVEKALESRSKKYLQYLRSIQSYCLRGNWVGEALLLYSGMGREQFVAGGVDVFNCCPPTECLGSGLGSDNSAINFVFSCIKRSFPQQSFQDYLQTS